MLTPPFIVKVCGVTTREDAQVALDAGANALGFNFYPQSPRYISPEAAAEISVATGGDYLRVGVFVHPTADVITPATAFLDVIQIHGQTLAVSHALPVWQAVSAGTIPAADGAVQAWLLDSFTPAFGGSGQTFDWSLAADFPYCAIVAGGLDGDNVAEAIRIAKPWGVDACSRLESSPGKKDHARVTAFVTHALEALNL